MDVNKSTKRLTFEWSRNAPDEVAQVAQGVDAKMAGILAAGSVVIGIAATTVGKEFDVTLINIPMGIAVVLYAVLLWLATNCLRSHRFRRPSNPEILREYWPYEFDKVLIWHSDLVLQCYEVNRSILNKKVRMLNLGLIFLVSETLALVLWMAIKTFA